MVLLWVGVAIGVLIAIILIAKMLRTPSHEAVSVNIYCKKCGYKTNGLKCPRCNQDPFSTKNYR